jgi:hypothetical protein
LGAAVLLVFVWHTQVAWAACGGDCNGDGQVNVNELVLSVDIALGAADIGECSETDANGDLRITIDELISAAGNSLNDCPAAAATATATATATPVVTPTPDIVPPGISTQLLGTFSGHAINDNTHVDKPARLKIAVVNGAVVVTDLGGNVFASGTTLTVTAVTPTAINSTNLLSGFIEIFQLTLVPDGRGTLAGTYSKSPLLNPFDMTNVFALVLNRES